MTEQDPQRASMQFDSRDASVSPTEVTLLTTGVTNATFLVDVRGGNVGAPLVSSVTGWPSASFLFSTSLFAAGLLCRSAVMVGDTVDAFSNAYAFKAATPSNGAVAGIAAAAAVVVVVVVGGCGALSTSASPAATSVDGVGIGGAGVASKAVDTSVADCCCC